MPAILMPAILMQTIVDLVNDMHRADAILVEQRMQGVVGKARHLGSKVRASNVRGGEPVERQRARAAAGG